MSISHTSTRTIVGVIKLIGPRKLILILALSSVMIFLDFSMAFLIGVVLSKLMGINDAVSQNITSQYFVFISLEVVLWFALAFVVLRTLAGIVINRTLYNVIYQAYHEILLDYWDKTTSSFGAISSLVHRKNIQKVFATDANVVIGGLLIPTIQVTIEICVLLLLIFFVFYEMINIYTVLASIIFTTVIMFPIGYFVSLNKKIGREKNILEENRTNFLSSFEKTAFDLFMFNRIKGLGEKLGQLNLEVSKKIAQHAFYIHGSRIVVEGLVYLMFFLVFILIALMDKERLSGMDWGLVSALMLRVLPMMSRTIQSAQSISYSLSPAASFIKSWEGKDLIEYEGAVRVTDKKIEIRRLNVISGADVLMTRENVCFDAGSITAITGASGAGKSTLLDAVFHLLRENSIPTSYLRQNFNLLTESIEEEFAFYRLSTNQLDQVKSTLDDLGLKNCLEASIDINSLSGGQRQRIALARTIWFGPKILLLDEFSSALDEATESDSFNVLAKLKETGFTIILSTHNQNIAKMCDHEMKI